MIRPALYRRHLSTHGDLEVWLVDGHYIRGHLDEEFTNFGQHYRFADIPKHELWIDESPTDEEYVFFIEHLLVEHRLMARGIPYEQALSQAGSIEMTLRRKEKPTQQLDKRLWKTFGNGPQAWIVRGRSVRDNFEINFTAGGHDLVYDFIPAQEIWIDDAINPPERDLILLHELFERRQMADGLPYDLAHAHSNHLEGWCRQHPEDLQRQLSLAGNIGEVVHAESS